jgi:hypothetical protein
LPKINYKTIAITVISLSNEQTRSAQSVIINVRENTDNKSLNEVEVAQLQNLVDKYSDVFVGLTQT